MVRHQEQRSRAYLLVSFKFFNVYIFCAEIALVQIYTLDKCTCLYKHTYTHKDIHAELFIVATFWTQSQYLSVGRLLNKLWYNHISKSYVASK